MSGHPQLRVIQQEPPAPAAERREALDHLRACAVCRVAMAEADPARLFALLALDRPAPDLLERISARVEAELSAEEPSMGRGRWPAGLALAASLLMAAVLGAYLLKAPDGGGGPRPDPSEGARPLEARSVPPAIAPTDEMIEVLSPSESVGVVELQVHETRVVMIFDEGLDL